MLHQTSSKCCRLKPCFKAQGYGEKEKRSPFQFRLHAARITGAPGACFSCNGCAPKISDKEPSTGVLTRKYTFIGSSCHINSSELSPQLTAHSRKNFQQSFPFTRTFCLGSRKNLLCCGGEEAQQFVNIMFNMTFGKLDLRC